MAETIKWSPGRKRDFEEYITNELEKTIGDRGALTMKWSELMIQFRARVLGDGTAEVPFIGASDVEFPLTGIHFEPIYADLMQTLHVPKNFWSIVPLRSDTVSTSKPFQEFLGIVERNFIKMRSINMKAFIDMIVLGTTIYKDVIDHSTVTAKGYDEAGEITDVTKISFQPKVLHVPLQDFFIPAYASFIDPDVVGGAPWVAHRFKLTEGQLRRRAEGEAPFRPNYEKSAVKKVSAWISDQQRERRVEETIRTEDEYRPFKDWKAELYEVWARWDVDGSGIEEDVVVVWSQDARTILQATYNPFQHGKRPFSAATYMPNFGFYGIGLAEQDEWAQLSMTRLVNNAVNNTLIVNQRMYTVPFGSTWQPDEPIYGGKIVQLGPNEKVGELKLGEVYPSMWQMMDRMFGWSEARTGGTDLKRGQISELPSRTPAATTQSILREGSQRFDMMLSNWREGPGNEIGQRLVQNLVQISQSDPRFIALATQVLGPEDGAKVADILGRPVPEIEDLFGINVTATSSQVNKEADKQDILNLAQTLGAQTYPALVQYAQSIAQMSQDPTLLLSTMQSAYSGQIEMATRLLEAFDIQNPEQYLPGVQEQGQAAPQPAPQPGQAAGAPAGPATAPLGGPAGPGPLAQGGGSLEALLGIG